MHRQAIRAHTPCGDEVTLNNLAIEAVSDGIFIADAIQAGSPIVYANPALERLAGASAEDILGRPAHRLLESWDSDLDLAPIRAAFRKGEATSAQLRLANGHRTSRWCTLRLSPIAQPSGPPAQYVGVLSDISREIEHTIHLQHLMRSLPDGVLITTEEGTIRDANPAAARLFGCSPSELRGLSIDDLIEGADGPRQGRIRKGLAQQSALVPREVAGRRQDGSSIELELAINEMQMGDNRLYIHALRDISRRKQMAAKLWKEQHFSDTILQTLRALVVVTDCEGRIVRFNRACERLSGYCFSEVKGRRIGDFLLLPEERDAVMAEMQRLISKGLTTRFEKHWLTKDGKRKLIRWASSYLTDEQDQVEFLVGTGIDITEQEQAKQEMRRSQDRLQLALEAAEDALWDWNIQTGEFYFSPRWATMLGYPAQDLAPHFDTFCALLHPDDAQDVEGSIRSYLSKPEGRYEQEFRLRHHSGEYRWIAGRAKVMGRGPRGEPVRMVGTCSDITGRKKVEGQLLQAQKMEAVGQLTGGMAHDFNNLLGVIVGSLELLDDSLAGKSKRNPQQLMRMADHAAQKAAKLVKRMLAFSRQQTLEPKVCNLNQLVKGLSELLHRTLGEDVEVELALGDGLWLTRVDAGQLESALLNLAINARDAMPKGGKLTIETSNVKLDDFSTADNSEAVQGRHVLVAVSDNGTGMAPDTVKRAMEPFFTTKSVARGTGLGLSMVYGFIKQSGGHVKIYSEEGYGTTVRLFLPCSALEPEQIDDREGQQAPTGTETILVVDDHDHVRMIVGAALEQLGYKVLEAENSDAALEFIRRDPSAAIDLLFTDTVMGEGMDGTALARAFLEQRPGTPVLFTSGFANHALRRNKDLASSQNILSKPYRRSELARKIRQILDAKSSEQRNEHQNQPTRQTLSSA